MTKRKTTKFLFDKRLLFTTFVLLIVGLLLVFSASSPEAVMKFGDGHFFVKKHAKFLVLGLFVMFFTANFDYRLYKKFAIPMIILSLILNLLVRTQLGKAELGQTRWLELPFLPRFMPSDTLKPASVIFLAYILEKIGPRIRKPQGVILSTVIILAFVGIVFSADLGSSFIIFLSLGFMLFASGIKFTSLGVLAVLGAIAVKISFRFERFGYRKDRLTGFLNPFADMQGDGMQLGNSIYSVALGGITGAGLGKGIQKFTYIPHVYNDFIFSVMAEELGLIGGVFLIGLFFNFAYASIRIALNTKSTFGKLLVVGLSSSIIVQAMIHIYVNIGLAPVTGITLPFISYGGTSLIITMFMTGIILNVSKENNRRKS